MNQVKNEPKAKRMKIFVKAVDKALLSARSSIDAKIAVEECYGEDASIFASDGDTIDLDGWISGKANETDAKEMLANLIDSMTERLNENLKSKIMSLLKEEGVDSILFQIESIIEKVEREKNEKWEDNKKDKNLTRKILNETSSLPQELDPIDVIRCMALKVKREEKDRLLSEIAKIKEENNELERQIEKAKTNINERIEAMEHVKNELSQAANSCTFSGLS